MSWHPPETEVHRPVKTERKTSKEKMAAGAGEKDRNGHRVMHVDMDAFFASVEQRDNPHLRGKPVIVGGKPGERGVVSTCSYEARAFGVHSGMSLAKAEKLCPHGEFVRTHGSKYVDASVKIVKIFHEFTPIVEPVSIDEAFLDITGSVRMYGSEEKLARAMKDEIYRRMHLTCSVGIAPTRTFAKLASGMNKPDGLTVLQPKDYTGIIYPMPVIKLYGIGEKTEAALHKVGIRTIGQLATSPEEKLRARFGKHGEKIRKTARGESSSTVVRADERPDEKSIGNEHTFQVDIGDMAKVDNMLLYLSQKVGRRARRAGFAGRTVTLKLRYSDFETHTHRETFPELIWDDVMIYKAARMLLDQIYETQRKIRLLGVTLSGLVKNESDKEEPESQIDVFSHAAGEKNCLPVFDILRDRFGEGIICRAGAKRSKFRM